ncbi:hypothetical protein A3K87_30500 [Variovorax paradoxus]|uniref:Uncharacterized protein n=1 Tax=Variovorax paradoxus TaxID=34073 RepID=A0AA91I8G3_VARPD|nr:hypothetical protein A3K87_30500 [Variovorax paradoxus]
MAKLQRFHRANFFSFNTMDHGRHRLQVFLDHDHRLRSESLEVSDDASDVFPHRFEQATILGVLHLTHQLWVQVVKAHRSKGIEDRPERGKA